jgi:hypothetical protein
MLNGMLSRYGSKFAALCVILPAGSLTAGTTAGFSQAGQSIPELNIRVYGFPGLSAGVLRGAYFEASRMLRRVSIGLRWVDCTAAALSIDCTTPDLPSVLPVHVLAKAFPSASPGALGLAAWSDDEGAAFLFYDRVVARRSQTAGLGSILGRVMAHEIAHLLLPQQPHSEIGLMRGQWSADDLRNSSFACLRLPEGSVFLMQKEARRRVLTSQHAAVR